MSPKWQRPTGQEQESGQRTYVSGQEYTTQMRTLTDRAALNKGEFHLSEFKKPYKAEGYEPMEHFYSWPSGHEFGFDWPPMEWLETTGGGKKIDDYQEPLTWDPALDIDSINAGTIQNIGVINNVGLVAWLPDLSGVTEGAIGYAYKERNRTQLELAPTFESHGSIVVKATDRRKKRKFIIKSIEIIPQMPEMVIGISVTGVGFRYFKVADLIAGTAPSFWNAPSNIWENTFGNTPTNADLVWWVPDGWSGPTKQIGEEEPFTVETQYTLRDGADLSIIRTAALCSLVVSGNIAIGDYYPTFSEARPGSADWRYQSEYGYIVHLSKITGYHRTVVDPITWLANPTYTHYPTVNMGSGIGLIELDSITTMMDESYFGWELLNAIPGQAGTKSTGTVWLAAERIDSLGANQNYCYFGLPAVDQPLCLNFNNTSYPLRIKGLIGGEAFDVTMTLPPDIQYIPRLMAGIPY